MEMFFLLRKIAIILPTLTVILPGLYKIYTEDVSAYCRGEELLKNKVHFSVTGNPLIEIFLYLRHKRSTLLTEPNNSGINPYKSAGVLPSIWSIISPYEYEDDEWKDDDTGQSVLTKAVCKDQGPFSFYFPEKQTWICQLVRGAEEILNEYFWELLLPLLSFVSAASMYLLVRQESFKSKWDTGLEFLRDTLSFNPKYPTVQSKIVPSKIEEVTLDTDTEEEIGDCAGKTEKFPCQCEMCSVQAAAQILLKQKLEELETSFF